MTETSETLAQLEARFEKGDHAPATVLALGRALLRAGRPRPALRVAHRALERGPHDEVAGLRGEAAAGLGFPSPRPGPRLACPPDVPGRGRRVTSLAFSPDGAALACGHQAGSLRVHDLEAGGVQALDRHKKGCTAVAFDARGGLASGGGDRKVLRWDLATGDAAVLVKKAPARLMTLVARGPGWQATCEDGHLLWVDPEGGVTQASWPRAHARYRMVPAAWRWSPGADGEAQDAALEEAAAAVLTGEQVQDQVLVDPWGAAVVVLGTGRLAVLGADLQRPEVLERPEVYRPRGIFYSHAPAAALAPGGAWMVLGSSGRLGLDRMDDDGPRPQGARLVDLRAGQSLDLADDDVVTAVAISRDAARLALGTSTGEVQVVELAD